MASAERRILQNSPKAPTPEHLLDGAALLLETHGKTSLSWFHESLGLDIKAQNEQGIVVAQILVEGDKPPTRIKIELYKKDAPAELEYVPANSVSIYHNKFGTVIAEDTFDILNRNLTPDGCKATAEIILMSWEALNNKDKTR